MESEPQIVQAILKQNEFLLRRHLVLSRTVLDQMKESGLIADVTRRKILAEPTHKQVPILLKSLEYKGLLSLRKFLDVLKSTGHGWMVDNILDTDVTAGGQERSKDDIGYIDRFQPAYTRPQPVTTDSYRRGQYPLRHDLRKSVTAGPSNHDPQWEKGVSLATLLKSREPPDPDVAPRGIINARTLLTDPLAGGAPYQSQFGGLPTQPPPFNQQLISYPRSKEDIPMTLYGLNQAFSNQDQKNQQALSVLRQEEIAIRQLMEQNARDQGNVRRKQAAVHDIVGRLRDIHNRAKEVYEPSPHPNIGRYRLAQLNQIPWSIDG